MTKLKLILNLGFIKEAISSFIPTSLAYIDIFKKTFTEHQAIALAILTFFILFIILIFVKIREYQKSVSKALANGYFKNFVEKLVNLCVSKGENKIPFLFESETKEFLPTQISIMIYIEKDYDSLKNRNDEIKGKASIGYISTSAFNYPFFVWTKIDNDKLIIYDLPRTLFSLKDYIDTDMQDENELNKETKPFYKRFNIEFRKLWTRLNKDGLTINLEYKSS